jgi:murein DD-endopeptidase MepM/ murein hydrolase activator NlpD
MRVRLVALAATVAAVLPAGYAAASCTPPDGSPLVTIRPLSGANVRLASAFGLRQHPILAVQRLHPGIDWSAPTGTPVLAAGSGLVLSAGPAGDDGNTVVIDHGAGRHTLYKHLASFSVRPGDCVEARTPIGKVGSTGIIAGPALHFEVHQDGEPIDPVLARGGTGR